MDLWIRSQDKLTLRRCNSLKIEKWEDKYAIVEQATVYGTYKTKEKAIDILNEIETDIMLYDDIYSYSMPEDIEETNEADNHIPHID